MGFNAAIVVFHAAALWLLGALIVWIIPMALINFSQNVRSRCTRGGHGPGHGLSEHTPTDGTPSQTLRTAS